MSFLKKLLIALAAIVIIGVIVGFILPSEYQVERTVSIEASPEAAFAMVNNLENWPKWGPWQKDDPSMKITYGDQKSGTGAWYSWQGEKHGQGKLTITKSVPHSRIETHLDFGDQGTGNGYFNFKPDNKLTHVTWGMTGDMGNNLIGRYFALFFDTLLGPFFERGLGDMKKMLESAPASQ